MREAAKAGDADALAAYVDFAGIDARARAAAPTYFVVPPDAAPADTPGGRRLREDLHAMLAAARRSPPMGFSDVAPWLSELPIHIGGFGPPGPHGYRAYIKRHGLNEFRLLDEKSPDNGGLTFRRRGLGWRLEEVRFMQQ